MLWEPILLLSSLAGLFGGTTWSIVHHQRNRLRFWRETAAAHGLHIKKISGLAAFRMRLWAEAGPLKVRIKDTEQSGLGKQIVLEIPGPPGFAGVRIRREQYIPAGAREIEIGDEAFDHTFFVEGPQRLLLLLLDAETRERLLYLNRIGPLEIRHGQLGMDLSGHAIPEVLPLLLALGRRFSERADAAQRLAENAQHDPKPGVRLRNLLFLAREHPGEPETIEALRTACTDPTPLIRLRAATELRAEGRDLLLELAESTDDDALSAQAVSALGRELPFERTRGILDYALRKRRLQTARACLEALGQRGDTEAVDLLEKVLDVERGELALAAAQALGAAGLPDAEPPLLRALQRERTDIRVAAAKALSRAGTTAAVLPLKEAAESARDNELRRAARQAIAGIQSRLQGASPGQLSLAGGEAGQLSLPDAEAGRLSLAQGEAGQLSLPPERPEPPNRLPAGL